MMSVMSSAKLTLRGKDDKCDKQCDCDDEDDDKSDSQAVGGLSPLPVRLRHTVENQNKQIYVH